MNALHCNVWASSHAMCMGHGNIWAMETYGLHRRLFVHYLSNSCPIFVQLLSNLSNSRPTFTCPIFVQLLSNLSNSRPTFTCPIFVQFLSTLSTISLILGMNNILSDASWRPYPIRNRSGNNSYVHMHGHERESSQRKMHSVS